MIAPFIPYWERKIRELRTRNKSESMLLRAYFPLQKNFYKRAISFTKAEKLGVRIVYEPEFLEMIR